MSEYMYAIKRMHLVCIGMQQEWMTAAGITHADIKNVELPVKTGHELVKKLDTWRGFNKAEVVKVLGEYNAFDIPAANPRDPRAGMHVCIAHAINMLTYAITVPCNDVCM